jgi:hypothetical protein
MAFGVQSPTWRPDGHALAFVASRRGAPGIYVVSDDGTGLRPLIARGRTGSGDPAFSPDGRFIAYSRAFRGSEIWIARADGSHPRLLIRNGRENIQPTWSPDGKRIAFVHRTASGDSSIRTISVASGREEPLTSGPDWDVEPLVVSHRRLDRVRAQAAELRSRPAGDRQSQGRRSVRARTAHPGRRSRGLVARQPSARIHEEACAGLGGVPARSPDRPYPQGHAKPNLGH